MAFKGFKKTDIDINNNHFEIVEKTTAKHVNQNIEKQSTTVQSNEGVQIGRPVVDEYKKQNKRIQFYVSQEMIDNLQDIAYKNGCKDVTAYAKKLFEKEFESIKNGQY